ncbi:uncharacterized protein METZ01_LOCUS176669 [marine metagenome]|uniref:Uncharacterized protein n=1 Tax=marine metagenome TaxID=408172 RepID=A0A382CCI0_9ZZZZ
MGYNRFVTQLLYLLNALNKSIAPRASSN